MSTISIRVAGGETGAVVNMFDESGDQTFDLRDAVVVACEFATFPQYRLCCVTPEHSPYTLKTLH